MKWRGCDPLHAHLPLPSNSPSTSGSNTGDFKTPISSSSEFEKFSVPCKRWVYINTESNPLILWLFLKVDYYKWLGCLGISSNEFPAVLIFLLLPSKQIFLTPNSLILFLSQWEEKDGISLDSLHYWFIFMKDSQSSDWWMPVPSVLSQRSHQPTFLWRGWRSFPCLLSICISSYVPLLTFTTEWNHL